MLFSPSRLRIIEWLGAWPFASVPVYGFGDAATVAYYAALLVVTSVIAQPPDTRQNLFAVLRRRWVRNGLLTALLVGIVIAGVWWYQRPDGKLHVVFSGNGAICANARRPADCVCGQHRAGPHGPGHADVGSHVELLIVPQRDDRARAEALPIVQRYVVGQLIMPAGDDEPSAALDAWNTALLGQVTSVITPAPSQDGQVIALEPGLTLSVQPGLGGAIGLKLTYGEVTFDLIGNARPIRATLSQDAVLFMSPRTADAEMLNAVGPRWVVWADAGGRVPGGLAPAIKTLALKDAGVVEFVSDGKGVTVRQ